MVDQSEMYQQRHLLQEQREALAKYLGQLAYFGKSNAPIDVFNSIAEARNLIRQIKRTLREGSVPVEDHPDDEEFDTRVEYENVYTPSEQEVESQKERLIAYRMHLRELLKRRAMQGISTPVNVELEIVDNRSSIRYIKGLLRAWAVPVDDHPDDEELLPENKSLLSQSSVSITAKDQPQQNNRNNSNFPDAYINALDSMRSEIVSVLKSEIDGLKDNNQHLLSTVERLQEEIKQVREVIYPKSIIEGEEDIQNEIKHQISLRRELTRRLHSLELEQARKGIDTPPQVETQISDIREQVTKIEARIKILTYDLERQNPQKAETKLI